MTPIPWLNYAELQPYKGSSVTTSHYRSIDDAEASTLQGFVCNAPAPAPLATNFALQPYKGSSVTILDLRETRLLTCGYNKELLSTLNKLHSTEG